MLSLIIPIYKSEACLPNLFAALEDLATQCKNTFKQELEIVFVNDGSPDRSYEIIQSKIQNFTFKCQLVGLTRNFGAFAAIREGLIQASGEYFAVMAADLQEPPELVIDFFKALLTNTVDITVGHRVSRNDPIISKVSSLIFWRLYRYLIFKEIPKNGVDIFGCNTNFKHHLISLNESNSSLIGLIYWLGFRRLEIPYTRRAREQGKSSWSFSKKIKYMLDSLFAFTDLPIKLLITFGLLGVIFSVMFSITILILRINNTITLPGYAATVTTIVFFGGLNSLGIGIVGNYTWRTYENSKARPLSIVQEKTRNY